MKKLLFAIAVALLQGAPAVSCVDIWIEHRAPTAAPIEDDDEGAPALPPAAEGAR
jgi:hypothetical protein